MSTIHDELDREFAPAWKPQPGEKLIGIVTDLSSREGEYGEYPIVTIRSEEGEFAAHCFHEVLASELARVAPKVGDHLGIKYVGKDPDKGYHRYRVRREGDESFDWARFGDPDTSPDTSVASEVRADTADLPVRGDESDDDIPF